MNNVMRRLRRCGWLAAAALAPLSAGPLFVVAGQAEDLGEIRSGQPEPRQHLNKFGQPYEPNPRGIY